MVAIGEPAVAPGRRTTKKPRRGGALNDDDID